jgi:hypothetical protein
VIHDDGTRETIDDDAETCEDVDRDNAKGEAEAEVTDKKPSFLATLFAPPVPKYVESDRPLGRDQARTLRNAGAAGAILPCKISLSVGYGYGTSTPAGEATRKNGFSVDTRADFGVKTSLGRRIHSNEGGTFSKVVRAGGSVGVTPDQKGTIGAEARLGVGEKFFLFGEAQATFPLRTPCSQ